MVSNIFYFHLYLGKISNLTNIFQMGWNHQLVDVCWMYVLKDGLVGRSWQYPWPSNNSHLFFKDNALWSFVMAGWGFNRRISRPHDWSSVLEISMPCQCSLILMIDPLPRKIAFQNLREMCRKRLKRHLQWRTIREWSEHDPTTIRAWNCKTEPVRSQSLLFPPRQRILHWKIQHLALRLSI